MINYILNNIKQKWVVSETNQERKIELFMTESYICATYGYPLRGYEGFSVDLQWLMDIIHLRKQYRREPHVLLEVMGIFKGEDGNRTNTPPLVN